MCRNFLHYNKMDRIVNVIFRIEGTFEKALAFLG